MRILFTFIFYLLYQGLFGILSCYYYIIIQKKSKENWKKYFFWTGTRLRIGLCLVLALFTADLCLYGCILNSE
jgi:hypothetical protein